MSFRSRIFFSAALAAVGTQAAVQSAPKPAEITLSSQCPASFELVKGVCKLRNQYLQFSSLQGAGVGGLKTGMPKFRDGFTPKQIDLGRYLFFDTALSGDGTVSCASCHKPDKGFSDGLPRSRGIKGQQLARNAPSLWNVGFQNKFFWDGRARSLEEQMQGPLYDAHEMGNTREALQARINALPEYRRLFASAYPEAKTAIRLDHIYTALSAFEASLVSLNSRYDLYAQGIHDALTPAEIEGMNVFRSFVARCAECHTPPLFSNQQIAVLGTPEPKGLAFDPGAGKTTGEPTLRGGFKVPSLRNVALTAPYNHSGRFSSLRDATEFYNLGRGHAVPKGEKLTLHWHIWEPRLSAREIDRLVDFLGALTDESFKPETPRILPSTIKTVNSNIKRTASSTLPRETP
ncbi:MAG: cytochrome-c peroxidase [Arenimonas sp.]|nr:cytochrome-c peroxidase [Arenimonas sp.]MBP7981505.1 cytochrome-c peroxidase [Arenimonas sp.]